ncbi:4a-hydroxytetrahydrobiopterin dehydratase [Oceanospirillum sediminis]|uniref:Putative pterin-4-alpha-carbinolamine dehydratase n=1 Tax=Oceanospirillum sediminis TaxID=2760088 RepID=A0A839IK83_9GAMM|nr:4a-hydroxytetrahydrobiopterin dehydratase [Oceanospirillum sediminis]MBB1485348.1 4a-hydroxytetrahydrobiopterin dehydratase [Oceanospirillum sediminis]
MSELSEFSCEACRSDAPRVTGDELEQLLSELPDWELEVIDNVRQITRTYTFSNFRTAMQFSNAIADLAESEGHHPAILTEWGKVTLSWWTHKIMGLHKNDFILAARSDDIYEKG